MRLITFNINGIGTAQESIKSRHGSLGKFFSEVLNADVLCLQETKLSEDRLTKALACVEGYESFWAISKTKKGYSGVATYVREGLAAQEALIDFVSASGGPEGRSIATFHQNLVIVNVYVPNGGEPERGKGPSSKPRLGYKMAFLTELRERCDAWVAQGRDVLLVGDLNVPRSQLDVYAELDVATRYTPAELAWVNGMAESYVDVFRAKHPGQPGHYTVWDERRSLRPVNKGLRIDYVLASAGLRDAAAAGEARILAGQDPISWSWSDHAAVLCDFPGLEDRVRAADGQRPCAGSSRSDARFSSRGQLSLTSMFARAGAGGAGGRGGGVAGGGARGAPGVTRGEVGKEAEEGGLKEAEVGLKEAREGDRGGDAGASTVLLAAGSETASQNGRGAGPGRMEAGAEGGGTAGVQGGVVSEGRRTEGAGKVGKRKAVQEAGPARKSRGGGKGAGRGREGGRGRQESLTKFFGSQGD